MRPVLAWFHCTAVSVVCTAAAASPDCHVQPVSIAASYADGICSVAFLASVQPMLLFGDRTPCYVHAALQYKGVFLLSWSKSSAHSISADDTASRYWALSQLYADTPRVNACRRLWLVGSGLQVLSS